jgi:transposase
MDVRQLKAQQIVAGGKITHAHGYWLVPSQTTGTRHKVTVDGLFSTCSCADFELTDQPCKHILAVRLHLEAVKNGTPPTPKTGPEPPIKRKTYAQDWPNYNAAQTAEKRHFQELLADLCQTVQEPPAKPGRPGRKPIRLADAAFAACYKVFSTVSARRFTCDLKEANRLGFVSQPLHFNSVLRSLDNEELTPVLHDLIRLSSLPLREVEQDFAVDSSGFCTSKFVRWFDVKYGVDRVEAVWVKAHIMAGVKTNVVTAVVIGDKHAGDSPQLPTLVEATAKGFKIAEVSADKAYTGTENFQAVEDVGGTLYSPFKKNATGAIGGIFEKAFHYFCLHREEFLQHYHKRSNVESTFSMVKRKFGDAVRSKTDVAQKNEVLAKFVCHNLCCVISAWYELGIEPVFGCTQIDGPALILRFPG